MDSTTRNMINSLTEDILQLLHVRTPIENMDELVCSLGGRIEEDVSYSEGAAQNYGDAFIIWVLPLQAEKRRRFPIALELGHLKW